MSASETFGDALLGGPDALTILDALAFPVLVIGPDDCARYANSAAEHFMSSSAAYLSRHSLLEFVPEDSPVVAAVAQARRSGRRVADYGIELGSHRLPTRPVDIQVQPFGSEGDVLVTLQERTIAVAMDRRLSTRAAARSVSGLAAILAHEIKNPLAGIKGAAQLLARQVDPDDQALTTLITEESDRICALVDSMGHFGEVKTHARGALNIHAVLERVKQIAETSFGAGIQITEEYDPSLPSVLGHRDELVQMFLNLVKNAADAAQDQVGSRVEMKTSYNAGVHLSAPGSYTGGGLPIEVRIIDNGPGIPEELKPHIFDPFVTSKHSGTGLGLALVAKIVGDHGGLIECDSEPGRTQFRVLLPMSREGANENSEAKDGR